MATRYDNVIVFGPTGNVGGATALEASKRGAKVWLAMRDPSKTIQGITDEQEKAGKFTRVKADLSDPESIKQAVQKSGAKAAYVYLILSPGGLKGALEAMKEAGIEYVVFLSSYTIKRTDDIREIPPSSLIPYIHAQVEILLEDLSIPHVTLRPGSFASNGFKMSLDRTKTPAEIYTFTSGKRPVDNIVPLDIGRVGGSVLVDRPSTASKEIIYLYGPSITNELETCNTISSLSPTEIKVIQQTPDEWSGRMKSQGLPPHVVDYFLKVADAADGEYYAGSAAKEGSDNIKKYSGYEPTSFPDYVKTQVS